MNKGILLTFNTVFFTVLFQFIFIRYASYEIDKEIYGNFVLLQTLIAGLSTVLLQIQVKHLIDFIMNLIIKQTLLINLELI